MLPALLMGLGGLGQLFGGIAAGQAASAGARKAGAQVEPFRQYGLRALGRYESLMDDPYGITQNPGYQFRLQQGLQGLMGNQAVGGKLFSGETAKGLMEYGQEYASSELDKVLAREMGLGQIGMQAAGVGSEAAMGGGKMQASAYQGLGESAGSLGLLGAYGAGTGWKFGSR